MDKKGSRDKKINRRFRTFVQANSSIKFFVMYVLCVTNNDNSILLNDDVMELQSSSGWKEFLIVDVLKKVLIVEDFNMRNDYQDIQLLFIYLIIKWKLNGTYQHLTKHGNLKLINKFNLVKVVS